MKDLFGNEQLPKKLDPKSERRKMFQKHHWQTPPKDDRVGKNDYGLTRDFLKFHENNPDVVHGLMKIIREMDSGRKLSIQTIKEIYRDATGIKVANDHRSFYARLLACKYPEIKDRFVFKRGHPDNPIFYSFLRKETGCGNPVAIFYGGQK